MPEQRTGHRPLEEHELAERFRLGEEQAVRHVYHRYGRAVFHLAAGGVASTADAEDVTQATLVAAWLGRATFDPQRGSLLGWLLGIARRQVVDRHRSRAREQRIAETVRAQPELPAAAGPERVLDRLLVADGLASLPAEQRRVLELAFFDDLSHRQVADLTGLPLGTVKSQIRRGMASLKQRWTVEGGPARTGGGRQSARAGGHGSASASGQGSAGAGRRHHQLDPLGEVGRRQCARRQVGSPARAGGSHQQRVAVEVP
jgi:RNA polymerase sigma-70 factor (ECF subfamily)